MNSEQRHRWLATALLEGEKKFWRVRGWKSMAILMNDLALEYQRRQNEVDSNRKVA